MSAGGWTLRLARPGDGAAMPAIERAAAELFIGAPDLAGFDADDTWEAPELERLIRKGHCLVSHVGTAMAGFLVAEPHGRELHIWEMNVHPRFQRRGIGASLVRAAIIDARNAGFAALTLTTFADLPWNAPFYQRLGFVACPPEVSHPRLAAVLAEEAADGLPIARRCAMILTLD